MSEVEHVHRYGPDLLCICGATPIDTIEELYAEARRERDETRLELEGFEEQVRILVVGMSNRLTLGDVDGARSYLAQWAETYLR
jgi:3-keto-L-gulonate-6-phosphate decarboxylase